MRYFDEFVSNTTAGSGNQCVFYPKDAGEIHTGRVYYRLTAGGTCRYSILYSNLTDTTFSDGSVSHANLVCDEWHIHAARIGVCSACNMETAAEPHGFIPVLFGGKPRKNVAPGEFFHTDPVTLTAEKGEYLCVELSFSGRMLPCHPESLLPAFVKTGNGFVRSTDQPFASMIGCDRRVTTRLSFLGDSITQGIGTPFNSYLHYCALITDSLDETVACWNLGLGFARAGDAAADGAWLFKAKQTDAVCVCLGVNDLFQVPNAEILKQNLLKTVRSLKKAGLRVLLQTVPPFNYSPDKALMWTDVNRYIRTLSPSEADMIFDVVPILGKPEAPHNALYGGHPDPRGTAVWAEKLLPDIQKLIGLTR